MPAHHAKRVLGAAIALTLVGAGLSAQALTGAVQGRVLTGGQPVANARVIVVGTSLGALTHDDGSYRIIGIPPGRYTIRLESPEPVSLEVTDVAIHAGETRTVDLGPEAQGVAVPLQRARDQATSRSFIEQETFHDLPITTAREAVALQAGVTDLGDPAGVSLRGSDPTSTGTFVDGAPVRNGQRGEVDLVLGTNGIAEAAVTTGVLEAGIGNAEAGAISFLTPGDRGAWQGSLRYRTDYPGFDAWQNVGLNLLEARLGGTIHGHLTFFTAATLKGQQSLDTQKDRDQQAPVYVMGGVDTVVHQPETWGDPLSDTTAFQIPQFVQYTGDCEASQNHGTACQGLRVPYTANGSYSWQGKLQQVYGHGSMVSVTGVVSQSQRREFPAADLYNPTNYVGTTLSSSAAILNWHHNLNSAFVLALNASYQTDERATGPLAPQSELDSRDHFGGFLFAPLRYVLDFDSTHTVRILSATYSGVHYLDDRQIQCLQAGDGACLDNVPYLDDPSVYSRQPYRLNPYATWYSNHLSLWTAGMDNPVDLSQEFRWQTRASADWATRGAGRIRLGAEFGGFETARYDDSQGMGSYFQLDAYREHPTEQGAFVEDRLDLGNVVLIGGLRWDRFDSHASYPNTPGRISSDPSVSFDPANPEKHFVAASPHSTWSPRLELLHAIDRRTDVRVSYGRQVQVPPFDLLFLHKNTDLDMGNRTMVFGRDIGFAETGLAEFGVRHVLGRNTLIDVAGYYKTLPAQPVFKLVRLPDPAIPTGMGTFDSSSFWVVTNADLGHVYGADIQLEHRVSQAFAAMLAFTYQSANSLEVNARQAVTGTVQLATPADWHAGSFFGALLANSSAVLTFRATSGQAYTQVENIDSGYTVLDPGGIPIEPVGSSRLPWTGTVNLRITRAFTVHRLTGRLFLESTNLANLTNVANRFLETNSDVNTGYRNRFISEQSFVLTYEAANAGILNGSTVDFTALPGGCAGWRGQNYGNYASGPVDCVMLERAERRFGNGDGIYTQAEYQKAFGAWYDLLNAPYSFYGPGRRIRVGVEMTF